MPSNANSIETQETGAYSPEELRLAIAIRRERRRRAAQNARQKYFDATGEAREGNPWPFIELQWGRILTADEVLEDRRIVWDLKRRGERFLILDDFQRDAIGSVFDPTIRETFLKGNTGCGKGAGAGIAVPAFFCAFPESKTVITRDSHQTAVRVMFREISQWWRRMAWHPPGVELLTASIIDTTNRAHYVEVASPDSGEGFSGVHAPQVLFVFDEATAQVLEERFSLADTQATKFLCMANPRTTSGRFHKAFHELTDDPDETQTVIGPYGRRRLITIGGKDCLNVRAKCLKIPIAPAGGIEIDGTEYEAGERIPPKEAQKAGPIIPGQTCYDEDLGHRANPDPRWVRVFADGKFPDEDPEKQLIFRHWLAGPGRAWEYFEDVRRRAKRSLSSETLLRLLDSFMPVESFGLDVGASDSRDPSVLTAGGRRGIRAQFHAQLGDAEEVADWVCETVLSQYGIDITESGAPICVDVDGVGWGVAGILRRRGCYVLEFRGNETSEEDSRRYANRRAEAYGEMAHRLNPKGEMKYPEKPGTGRKFRSTWRRYREAILLVPPIDTLREDLAAVEKIYARDGFRFGITPKRKAPGVKNQPVTVHEKLGRSPDEGDSAVYWWRAQQAVGLSLEDALDAGFF